MALLSYQLGEYLLLYPATLLAVIQEINLQRLGLNSQGGGAGHFPGISNSLRDWFVAMPDEAL